MKCNRPQLFTGLKTKNKAIALLPEKHRAIALYTYINEVQMNSIVKAQRATILLGSVEVEVFMLPDGSYRLSQSQVLEIVGVNKNWISRLQSSTPEIFKALQSKGFSGYSQSISISDESKARQAKTLSIDDARRIWGWFARKGNDTALDLLEAAAAEAIERRADAVFGIQRAEEERNEYLATRMRGKQVHRQLTDAIKSYIERHPELSENDKRWLFVNTSQRVALVVFGRKTSKLAEDLNANKDHLRDALTQEELLLVQEVEDTAIRLIDLHDIRPDDAVRQAADRLLIPVQSRKLLT